MTSSAPLARYLWRCISTSPSTIRRLYGAHDRRYADRPVAGCEPELRAPAQVRGHLGGMDHVFLLRQARNVQHACRSTYFRSTTATRFPSAASVHDSSLPATASAAENDEVVVFGPGHGLLL